MKLIDHLDNETVAKLNDLKNGKGKGQPKSKTSKNKCKTRLNKRDVLELMGTKRPTYKRGKGGAFRQR